MPGIFDRFSELLIGRAENIAGFQPSIRSSDHSGTAIIAIVSTRRQKPDMRIAPKRTTYLTMTVQYLISHRSALFCVASRFCHAQDC